MYEPMPANIPTIAAKPLTLSANNLLGSIVLVEDVIVFNAYAIPGRIWPVVV